LRRDVGKSGRAVRRERGVGARRGERVRHRIPVTSSKLAIVENAVLREDKSD
jgi:hypothetical protein